VSGMDAPYFIFWFEGLTEKEVDDLALLGIDYFRHEEDVMVTDYEVHP